MVDPEVVDPEAGFWKIDVKPSTSPSSRRNLRPSNIRHVSGNPILEAEIAGSWRRGSVIANQNEEN
jgi:hypothetical protein